MRRACRLDISVGWSRVAWAINRPSSQGRQMRGHEGHLVSYMLLPCIPGLVGSWVNRYVAGAALVAGCGQVGGCRASGSWLRMLGFGATKSSRQGL